MEVFYGDGRAAAGRERKREREERVNLWPSRVYISGEEMECGERGSLP